MKKLLFTGASGFLGYNIRPILEKNYDVHTIGLTDGDDIKFNIAKGVPPINTHYDVVLEFTDEAYMDIAKSVPKDTGARGIATIIQSLKKDIIWEAKKGDKVIVTGAKSFRVEHENDNEYET